MREGKGFVAAHVALTAFESWPEFGELIGARFDGHPITGAGHVINESPDFPATKHFPASFPFNDEFYQPKDFSRDKIDVLLRLDLSNVPANPALHLNGDYPLAWAKTYGKGRVFFGRSRTRPRPGTSATSSRCTSRRCAGRWGLTDAEPKPHPMRGSAGRRSRGRGRGER